MLPLNFSSSVRLLLLFILITVLSIIFVQGEYVVSTVAGTIGSSGDTDATGTNARFRSPTGLVFSSSGDLYIADQNNNVIRKMTTGGEVTTIAGNVEGFGPIDGTGTNALFNSPFGLVFSSSGDLYIADQGNHAIRKMTTGGEVTTIAGTLGFSGKTDATGTNALFNSPSGLVFSSSGDLYIADRSNNAIRKLSLPSSLVNQPSPISVNKKTKSKKSGIKKAKSKTHKKEKRIGNL
jgi:secreted PhoX family phosphatase